MKKIIELKHHMHDFECMWNGIEDLYINKMNEILPENFFFLLSGFGSFCYMKTPKDEYKRMIALGDGRTKKMYEFLAPIVQFDYKHYSYGNFSQALKKAKMEINNGYPVVLGALDMYYLPYFKKLYHKEHIPFHYVLMIGYNDDEECIYLYDCGRVEVISLSYQELELAMNCSYPGLSKENTICTIRMNSNKNKYEIAKEALKIKKDKFLNPKVDFIGYKGFNKFIKELPILKEELGKTEYDKILLNMVTFFGTVPTIPNALKGIDEKDEVVFKGGFDKMSKMLYSMGTEYNDNDWIEASKTFEKGSLIIEKISNIIINYLSKKEDKLDNIPKMFSETLEYMIKAYNFI